ncbi:MAG: cytochrome c biogenesis protein CcsA [Myxococcota bacterium]
MKQRWEHLVGVAGALLLAYGSWLGLFVTPPDRMQGDVMRIMYVHVPAAWAALLAFTVAFVAAIVSLWTARAAWDALLEACTEVGVVLGILLLALGSAWARPIWGVWWDWDPRLTTSAVLVLAFLGILALRGFVDDARQRATWSAVAAIVAFVDVPVVYYSVRWWRSLHQVQSTKSTMDATMYEALLVNSLAFVLVGTWLVVRRWRIAREQQRLEMA